MINELLSSKEIYTGFVESPKLKNKLIILFMLSTGIKSEDIIELRINDLLMGCGMDINDKNALQDLLDKNPMEILPYWIINNGPNIKFIFNSYEASFHLFLYLKDRFNNINDYNEPLFSSDDKGSAFQAKSIRTNITKKQSNKNFNQSSLVNKFENICENYTTDDEIKNLFLGESNDYESKDQLKEKLKDDFFMDRLISEYKKIVPYLTASYYMYEHLNNFISPKNVEDVYKYKIKNYFDNNFQLHFRDLTNVRQGILLDNAYIQAESDIENNIYNESDIYFEKLLKRAEITTVFENSKYHLTQQEYELHFEDVDYDTYFDDLSPEHKVDHIKKTIEEINVANIYNLDPNDIEQTIINQLALKGCFNGRFSYFEYEKVVLDTIFDLLNIL